MSLRRISFGMKIGAHRKTRLSAGMSGSPTTAGRLIGTDQIYRNSCRHDLNLSNGGHLAIFVCFRSVMDQ